MKTSQIAIRLTSVSKRYTIHHEKPTLVERFTKGRDEEFWALKDINLTIKKGERVGVIGPNGSGKTTLLKIIAGITTPTQGTIELYGKIVSLIDLEAGFHSELTGEQNIYLNGMLLGMKKEEIDGKLDAIIRFADIGQFIDAPLFTYSAGMKLRLGFAIAIHADPDIFLIDEALVVGDSDFQEKCMRALHALPKETVVLLASHQLPQLYSSCDRFFKLSGGRERQCLSPSAVCLLMSLPMGSAFEARAESNSMAPVIKKGDVLTVKRITFASVRPNDVIAFWLPKLREIIVHRAIAKAGTHGASVFTKGDASPTHDYWRVAKENFLGAVIHIQRATREETG